jgi:hypothetical protein
MPHIMIKFIESGISPNQSYDGGNYKYYPTQQVLSEKMFSYKWLNELLIHGC